MIRYGIVVHGGVGSSVSARDGCVRAAEIGMEVLRRGGAALDAAVESAAALEDDGRYNAGRGSVIRLDGRTVEMDASVMDSAGGIGAVAGISRVRNPVRVAREVMRTPHVLLCGEGAREFARRRGFPDFFDPTPEARRRWERTVKLIGEGRIAELRGSWENFDLRSNWNFEVPYEQVFGSAAGAPPAGDEAPGDTIGAVAIDARGALAVAGSTGGASPMLRGRVGDTPLAGCGFWAGPAAAVAATGVGEEIVRRLLSRQVHDWIAQGEEVRSACERGVALAPGGASIGLIAVGRRGFGIAANREMAAAEMVVLGS